MVAWTYCFQVDLKKGMDLLPPVDHSSMEYDEFGKDFYTEHPSIASMTLQQVSGHRGKQCAT
jgi:ATP-dependent RNA helicase DDX42